MKNISIKRQGGVWFVGLWRFRFSFCMARETVAERDAKRAASFQYVDCNGRNGYIVTVKLYGDGFAYIMPGVLMRPDVNPCDLIDIPAGASWTDKQSGRVHA